MSGRRGNLSFTETFDGRLINLQATMVEKTWTTRCSGFKFYIPALRPLTTRRIARICDRLSSWFTEHYGAEYRFEPEPISEGGLQIVAWPGKKEEQYKSMRFHIMNDRHTMADWPQIVPGKTIEEWRNNAPKNIFSSPWGYTFFKAFDAPVWTRDEVAMIVSAFESFGYRVLRSSIPSGKKLGSSPHKK